MSKKVVKKAAAKPKSHCIHKTCESQTVYMKRNRKTQEMEHWCLKHWQSDVEGKHPERYRSQPVAKPKKRKVVRKK